MGLFKSKQSESATNAEEEKIGKGTAIKNKINLVKSALTRKNLK